MEHWRFENNSKSFTDAVKLVELSDSILEEEVHDTSVDDKVKVATVDSTPLIVKQLCCRLFLNAENTKQKLQSLQSVNCIFDL